MRIGGPNCMLIDRQNAALRAIRSVSINRRGKMPGKILLIKRYTNGHVAFLKLEFNMRPGGGIGKALANAFVE